MGKCPTQGHSSGAQADDVPEANCRGARRSPQSEPFAGIRQATVAQEHTGPPRCQRLSASRPSMRTSPVGRAMVEQVMHGVNEGHMGKGLWKVPPEAPRQRIVFLGQESQVVA